MRQAKPFIRGSIAFGIGIALFGCGKSSDTTSVEDSSASGSVASAIGGAYSGSNGSGTMARLDISLLMDRLSALSSPFTVASASTACPVFSNAAIGTTLTYNNCSFGTSSAVWNGSVSFSGTAGSSVTRVITNGTTRTSARGTVISIDTSGANLTPFNGDAAPSGGSTATITSGSVTGLAINGVALKGSTSSGLTLFRHVVTTSNSDGGTALSLSGGSLTGTVITYHQLAKVKATSVVNVGMSAGCCTPTSGTITTTFNTSASGALVKYNGVTETLTFTSCGTAVYSGPEGYTGNVSLTHCL